MGGEARIELLHASASGTFIAISGEWSRVASSEAKEVLMVVRPIKSGIVELT